MAGERAGSAAAAVLPLSAFGAFSTGVSTGGFSEDNYVDLFPAEAATLSWRIYCGGDAALAEKIAGQLGGLGLRRA